MKWLIRLLQHRRMEAELEKGLAYHRERQVADLIARSRSSRSRAKKRNHRRPEAGNELRLVSRSVPSAASQIARYSESMNLGIGFSGIGVDLALTMVAVIIPTIPHDHQGLAGPARGPQPVQSKIYGIHKSRSATRSHKTKPAVDPRSIRGHVHFH